MTLDEFLALCNHPGDALGEHEGGILLSRDEKVVEEAGESVRIHATANWCQYGVNHTQKRERRAPDHCLLRVEKRWR